jgi:hypothetical protein
VLAGGGVGAPALVGLAVGAAHYVPFALASYAAWIGIAVAVLGLLSVVRPIRFLGIRSRSRGMLVLAVGAALTITAVLWPTSIVRATGPHQRLDEFLPDYQFREYHEAVARAPIERVIEAARRVSFADMPAAVFLLWVRHMAAGQVEAMPLDRRPILEMMAHPGTGFLPLDVSDPREVVFGMAGKPWSNEPPPRVSTPEEFRAFRAPGQIRVAFDIRLVEERPGVVRVSTETRILGNDPGASRVFARYWRVIYPGSAIIRRVWLDAIVARAERRAP